MKYEIKNGNVIITGYSSGGLAVEIPAEIEGHAVTEVASYAFSGTNIEEIFLPESVKKIGRYAFYNCKKLRKIGIYNTLQDLGSGAFIGCHAVQEVEITFVGDKKSRLRDFLMDLSEKQKVIMHMPDGDATLIFPEYFEEAIENTPARNLSTEMHGGGMLYRNCFVQLELNMQMYDGCFEKARAREFDETMIALAMQRLMCPYQLEDKFAECYEAYLKEHLEMALQLIGEKKRKEEFLFLVNRCVMTAEEMEMSILVANEKGMAEVMSVLMQEKRNKFGVKRKTFEL